jgi:hypothetical protein
LFPFSGFTNRDGVGDRAIWQSVDAEAMRLIWLWTVLRRASFKLSIPHNGTVKQLSLEVFPGFCRAACHGGTTFLRWAFGDPAEILQNFRVDRKRFVKVCRTTAVGILR